MTFAAGSFSAIARIHAIKNNISIAWLYERFTSMMGLHPANRETVAFLCFGFASVLFGLGLREWMKLNGHQKWKRIAGPILLACVLLISSLLMGWFSLAKNQIYQSEEGQTRSWAGRVHVSHQPSMNTAGVPCSVGNVKLTQTYLNQFDLIAKPEELTALGANGRSVTAKHAENKCQQIVMLRDI